MSPWWNRLHYGLTTVILWGAAALMLDLFARSFSARLCVELGALLTMGAWARSQWYAGQAAAYRDMADKLGGDILKSQGARLEQLEREILQ